VIFKTFTSNAFYLCELRVRNFKEIVKQPTGMRKCFQADIMYILEQQIFKYSIQVAEKKALFKPKEKCNAPHSNSSQDRPQRR